MFSGAWPDAALENQCVVLSNKLLMVLDPGSYWNLEFSYHITEDISHTISAQFQAPHFISFKSGLESLKRLTSLIYISKVSTQANKYIYQL